MKNISKDKKIKVQSTRLLQRNVIILFCLTLLLSPFGNMGQVQAAGAFAGGTGTELDPYEIKTAEELNEVRNHLDDHFILTANIDLDDNPYNHGAGWEPIGKIGSPFTGSFDGNGHTISNLMINREIEEQVGLFGVIEGAITRVTLDGVNVKGQKEVGGLVGVAMEGSSITESQSSGDVESTGSYTGGLVGSTAGEIKNSSATGQVNGINYVGGLTGWSSTPSSIINSDASVVVDGVSRVGGLVGRNSGEIVGSSATGEVNGETHVGGLIGHLPDNGSITNSGSSAEVNGESNVGGLVGYSNGSIEGSSASGAVKGEKYVGGLAGNSNTGSSITDSHSSGNVEGTDGNVGGLVGMTTETIARSSANGSVEGTDATGGLVGTLLGGAIQESYASGDVFGKVAGGLVGIQYRDTEIIDTYAWGMVRGTQDAGGLVGSAQSGSEIQNSYAVGFVGDENVTYEIGGLIGKTYIPLPAVDDSFYDSDTTGQGDDDGRGMPKTTTEMQNVSTFINWDFTSIWDMPANGYPQLQWEGITPAPGGDVTVTYVDEDGNEIADEVVKTGNLGESYTAEEKQITGYTFKEIIGAETGTFTTAEREVKFVYTEDDVVAPTFTVTVTHVDEDGDTLVPETTLTGELDAPYTTEAEEIDGYTLTGTPSNATGTFGSMDIEVVYVYSKDQDDLEVPTFTVTVTHVNEDGNTLVPETILTGELDTPYTTKAEEIDGYTLTDAPSNATGTFGSMDIEVTYVYKQDEKPKEDLVVTVEEGSSDDSLGDSTKDKLPKTATPYYTILFAGLLLILIGGVVYIVARKKQVI